jgi:hypothetical protein
MTPKGEEHHHHGDYASIYITENHPPIATTLRMKQDDKGIQTDLYLLESLFPDTQPPSATLNVVGPAY